jgi:hypothetical protein
MAITTVNGIIGSVKQTPGYKKTAARTTVANGWFSLLDLAGSPGAGVLAGANTANGIVPSAGNAGFPQIAAFGGSAEGRIGNIDFGSTVACRIRVFDLLFKAGAYAFNANTALASQPSFLSRIPGGTAADCAGITELWAEMATAATGNQAVNITYTNSAGTAGRTTGATGIGAAPTLGRCWQLPFQAGDNGVQSITNVAGSVATVGTFNVLVLRPLWTGRVRAANDGDIHDYLRTGFKRIFETSALYVLVSADGTSSGVPEIDYTINVG